MERPRNPRTCPSCGETVMRPAELSEPGSNSNSLNTEEFDVDSALSELDEMKSSPSKNTTDSASNSTNQEKDSLQSESTPSKENKGGILSRLKSLF